MENIVYKFKHKDMNYVRKILGAIVIKFSCFVSPNYRERKVTISARTEDIPKIKKILEFI